MAAKRVLVLAGDFAEVLEVFVPVQSMLMLGFQVDTICPDKKAGETIATAVHDFTGEQTYSEKRGHNFTLNATFSEVKANLSSYHGLYIPGGRAPEYLRLNPEVIDIVKYFFDNNKPVAAVCHAVQLLAAAGVLTGKKCSGYYACQPEVTLSGAQYQKLELEDALVDGNLVTAVAWTAHPKFLAKFIELLGVKVAFTWAKT